MKISSKHKSHVNTLFLTWSQTTLTRSILIDDITIPMLIDFGANVNIIEGQIFELLRSQRPKIKLKRLYNNPKHDITTNNLTTKNGCDDILICAKDTSDHDKSLKVVLYTLETQSLALV
ncbi:hypothetical protein GJ496_005255 [Pomphorhynchus laevis]|nr:hypothetical protein GJ496_005255 [Pomphorhynchus laevis]